MSCITYANFSTLTWQDSVGSWQPGTLSNLNVLVAPGSNFLYAISIDAYVHVGYLSSDGSGKVCEAVEQEPGQGPWVIQCYT